MLPKKCFLIKPVRAKKIFDVLNWKTKFSPLRKNSLVIFAAQQDAKKKADYTKNSCVKKKLERKQRNWKYRKERRLNKTGEETPIFWRSDAEFLIQCLKKCSEVNVHTKYQLNSFQTPIWRRFQFSSFDERTQRCRSSAVLGEWLLENDEWKHPSSLWSKAFTVIAVSIIMKKLHLIWYCTRFRKIESRFLWG